MKRFPAVCLLSLPILSACGPLPPLAIDTGAGAARALNTVDLRQPNVTLTFLSTGKTHRTGDTFPPPKTIDCSRLRFVPDAFKDAIEAGALVVQLQTPPEVKKKVVDKDGKETIEIVKIKPTYRGVLALCKVSPRATGAESRSYHIRDLDEYLIKGKDNLVSLAVAPLSQSNQADPFQELLNISMGPSFQAISAGRSSYSWMLWLTDNPIIFTDYEAEVARRKASKPRPTTPAVSTPRTP
ncbi:MAG: hypothetical protein CDV28_10860 [Candidatus Electronema aureum]|uniref:Lipoprotein n=1 Tax=Candidatus Electronema aureum TaxID=2005002 RepID=A0A521G371_9BACT|nr:MAG: hypothetical protein CDV28_10860 [Candidatus Electronema aureum]